MKIIYGKQLNNMEVQLINEIALSCDITFDTARILYYRNQNSIEKVNRFLNPSKLGFHNPLLLNSMSKAVEIIDKARLLNKNVLVFGDYDADGVCAATILYNCLKDYGISSIRVFVPERIDGYGINLQTIEKLRQEENVDLLITVDCGVSDAEKIQTLIDSGIEVIVTDHHELPEILPNCTVINPKLSNQDYPFDGLCGAGVAYKLGYALIGEKANEYLDFVALATVADSMDLIDENRDIVAEGLKLFNNPNKIRPCMKYLIGDNNKNIYAHTLAYSVAPRINAGGRMGDANCALQLFINNDENVIYDLAIKLNEYNIQRQIKCDEIYQQSKEKIKKYALYKRNVIVLKDKNWQTGFVGIVAARLVEEYARPVIVFAGQDDYLKGSARSVDGINIYEAINNNKEHLIGFGGHSQAAGISVSYENFNEFEKSLNTYVKENYSNVEISSKIYVEWNVEGEFSSRFAKEIELLEPFGVGNRNPLFSIDAKSICSMPIKENSPHYSFKTETMEMLEFNGQKDVSLLALPIDKKIIFEVNVSTFRNRENIKGYVKAICADYTDLSVLSLHALDIQLESLIEEEGKYKFIDKDNLQLRDDIITLYVVSDEENLKFYPQLKDLQKNVFNVDNKRFLSQIVFAPISIPDEYDRVVYLDKPLQVLKSNVKTCVVKDIVGYKLIEKINVDRETFAKIFVKLKQCNNKFFVNFVDFTNRNSGSIGKEQFLFALKVFVELKIFEVDNHLFRYNEKTKNALTNSKLYSKIVLLKDNYV